MNGGSLTWGNTLSRACQLCRRLPTNGITKVDSRNYNVESLILKEQREKVVLATQFLQDFSIISQKGGSGTTSSQYHGIFLDML